MAIKSYVVFPEIGKQSELIQAIRDIPECEIHPAKNKDLVVLVTDTRNKEAEDVLTQKLMNIPYLKHMSLVAGYSDDAVNSKNKG